MKVFDTSHLSSIFHSFCEKQSTESLAFVLGHMMSIVRQNEKNEHKDGGQWTATKASLGRPATGTVKLPRTVEMSFNFKQKLIILSLVKTGALSIQVAYTFISLLSLSRSHSVCDFFDKE